MTTGADLNKYIKDGIDQSFSGFLGTLRANRLIKDSHIKVIERLYSNNKTQKQTDELSPLTLIDRTITVRGNSFRTEPLRISSFTVVGTTATITTDFPHQLIVGDSLTIEETTGFTPALNGTYTVVSTPTTTQLTVTVVVVVGTWTQGSGGITHNFMFPNMLHPLAIETTFKDNDLMFLSTVNTGSTPYISFTKYSSVRTGSRIVIENALGVTGLNATFYCKERNRTSYFLFTDALFQTAAVLTGTYQGNGRARMVVSEYATRLHSDRRIAPSSVGDAWAPKFAIDQNAILLFPTDATCESVKVDYIQAPVVDIDVANTSVDLEQYYTFKHIMSIKDQCVTSFMMEMRELQQAQAQAAMQQANP